MSDDNEYGSEAMIQALLNAKGLTEAEIRQGRRAALCSELMRGFIKKFPTPELRKKNFWRWEKMLKDTGL